MIRLCHLLDGSAGWEQRVGLTPLLDRLSRDRYHQQIALISPSARNPLHHFDSDKTLTHLRSLPGLEVLTAPILARFVEREQINVIHAWSVQSALTARLAADVPLVIHLSDPRLAVRHAKLLRTLSRPSRFAIACSSQIVRRRLVEGGVDPRLAVVIRPGIDFGLINRYRRTPTRETLGLSRDDFVVILPEPVERASGQFEAVRAILHQNCLPADRIRVIVPGPSCEQRRIERFAAAMPVGRTVITPGEAYPFEQLLAACDALLIAPRGDASTTAVAWAMGAGAAVIGSAVYAVAEMIANKVNGLLFKQGPSRSMNTDLLDRLLDRASQERVREVARGQAYEIFGLRRYVEQHAQLVENLPAGSDPGDGISDSSIDV